MTDLSTFGHTLGLARLLNRRKQITVPQIPDPKPPHEEPAPRPRKMRQATKPSLAKRRAKRKIRNKMAKQSRRINRR